MEEKEFRKYYKERFNFLNKLEDKNPYIEGMITELNRIKEIVFNDFKPKEAKKKNGEKRKMLGLS